MPSSRTNWHEAITCAIQIDLRDYSHFLEYKMEHFLSYNRNRIDLLIIRKQLDIHIPKHIASLFLTLSFPTFHYPQKLFRHLTKECNKAIENPFPGVYYIKKEMYATQVLVIPELSPEDSLYLHCLTQNLNDQRIINNLSHDYALHQNDNLYKMYLNQLSNSHKKGDPFIFFVYMAPEPIYPLIVPFLQEFFQRLPDKERGQFHTPSQWP